MPTELAVGYISLVADASKIPRQIDAALGTVGRDADKHGARIGQRMSSGITGAVKSGVAGIGATLGLSVGAAAFGQIIKLGNDFTTSLNTMRAVSNATANEMAQVSARAKELGNDVALPGTSASDAAAAMLELAKGGFTVGQSMEAARGSLQLAAAAQIGAADAATIQVAALQSFGLAATDAGRVSDVLANAANASSAEITDVAYALQAGGAVAHGFGLTIEDTAAAIGLMANSGIKGSDAGTLLKSALLALTDTGKPAQAAIAELGLSVYDAQGRFVGLHSLFEQLDAAAGRMTDQQYQAATSVLFGSDAMRLSSIAAEKGAAGFDQMHDAMSRQGSAADVAAAKMQGLPGAMQQVQNAAEGLGLGIYDVVKGPLEDLATGTAGFVTDQTPNLVSGLEAGGHALGEVGKVLGPVARGFLGLPGPVQAATAALVLMRTTGLGAGFASAANTATSVIGKVAAGTRDLATATGRTAEVAGFGTTQLGRFGSAVQQLGTTAPVVARMQTSFLNAAAGANTLARTQGTLSAGAIGLKAAAGGMVSLLGGPWTLAVGAAALGLGYLASKHQQAAAAAEQQRQRLLELGQTLDEQSGKATQATLDVAAKQLEERGFLQRAQTLGISTNQLTRAATGIDPAARAEINAQLTKAVSDALARDSFFGEQVRSQAGRAGLSDQDVAAALSGVPEAVQKYSDASRTVALPDLSQLKKTLDDSGESAATLGGELNGVNTELGKMGESNRRIQEAKAGAHDLTDQGLRDFAALGLAIDQVLVNDGKTVTIQTPTDEQKAKLAELGQITKTLPDGSVTVVLNDDQARADIAEILRPATKPVTIAIDDTQINPGARRAQDPGSGDYGTITGGHVGGRADGGIDNLPGQATVWPPGTRFFQVAEPETGGEAFIPLAQSKRSRSLGILSTVADMFGYGLTKMAEGGITGKVPRGIANALAAARSVTGNVYAWGGTGPTAFDCSGFVGWLQQIAMGIVGSTERLYTTHSLLAGQTAGLKSGLGPAGTWFRVGVNQQHMAASIAGQPVEAGGSHNTSRIGAPAVGATDGQFTAHFYLPNALIDGIGAVARKGKSKVKDWTESDEIDLEQAQLSVEDARAQRDKVYADAKSDDRDKRRADLAVREAETRLREKQTEKDEAAADAGADDYTPEAPPLEKRLNDDEIAWEQAQLSVDEAKARRDEVYADPESTDRDTRRADLQLQSALNDRDKAQRERDKKSFAGQTASLLQKAGTELLNVATGAISEMTPFGLGELVKIKVNNPWEYDPTDHPPVRFAKFVGSQEEIDQQLPVTLPPGADPRALLAPYIKQAPQSIQDWIQGSVKVFDQGGWLEPGDLAVNLSRRPEPIFNSPQQLRQFLDVIPAPASTGSGNTEQWNITNNGMDPKSSAAAVERIRRRRLLADQRKGGFGR